MGFELRLVLCCDNCEAEEPHGPGVVEDRLVLPPLPDGWEADFVNNWGSFDHICNNCAAELSGDAQP